jgi:hypothetical protein
MATALLSLSAGAQSVAVNTDGSNADASAMLDVKSSSKGILIPRLDSNSRKAIASPGNGLMVFDTDTKSFWYYSNSAWNEVVGTSRTVAFAVTLKTSAVVTSSPVVFDSIIYNKGGGYLYSAPTISYFQAPQDGLYHFNVLISGTQASGAFFQVSLYKTTGANTTRPITTVQRPTGSFAQAFSFSVDLLLQKNDIIRLWIEGNTVTASGADMNRFDGYKVF